MLSLAGFGLTGMLDALSSTHFTSAVRAGGVYGLGGAVGALAFVLLSLVFVAVSERPVAPLNRGIVAAVWNVSLLLAVYLLFWLHAQVLAGRPWYDAISLLVSGGIVGIWMGSCLMVWRLLSESPMPLVWMTPRRSMASVAVLSTVTIWLGWLSDGEGIRRDERGKLDESDRPNIVVIVLDAVRADFTSMHGYHLPTTPSMHAAAERGLQFRNAHSTASWTLPAVTSLLTSRLAGLDVEPGASAAISEGSSLPEWLSAAGYTTVAVSSNPHVIGPFGVARRFQLTFDGRRGLVPHGTVAGEIVGRFLPIDDGDLADRALRCLRDLPRPFFLYVHLMGGHAPYRPPDGYSAMIEVTSTEREIDFPVAELQITPEERNSLLSRYAATIRHSDEHAGRLLRFLADQGRADDSLVLLTSDHGEEFGEHGGWTHGRSLHSEILHVPMIWQWPGRVRPGVRDDIASLLDVAPTILGAVFPDRVARFPSEWQGRDLALTGGPRPGDRPVFAESAPSLRSVITREWKYLVDEESGDERLYRRRDDPAETRDVAAEFQDVLALFRGRLEEATGAGALTERSDFESPSPELLRQLEALGYVR